MGTFLKLFAGLCLLVTSAYCFAASLPYTFMFLIKAPPFAWMAWFAHHGVLVYWIASVALAYAFYPGRITKIYLAALGLQVGLGIWMTAGRVIENVSSNWTAWVFGVAVLVPVLILSAAENLRFRAADEENREAGLLPYSTGIALAIAVAVVSVVGLHLQDYFDGSGFNLDRAHVELAVWSAVAHAWLAVVVVTLLNAGYLIAKRFCSRPQTVRVFLVVLLVFAGCVMASLRYLENTLTVRSWPATLYSVVLAATLISLGFSLLSPILAARASHTPKITLSLVSVSAIAGLLALPALIVNADWNDLFQYAFTLAAWVLLAVCAYGLRSRRTLYSIPAIIAVLLLGGVVYKGVEMSAVVWAKEIAPTEDDLYATLQEYADRDASFGLVHRALVRPTTEPCDNFCRTMRQYTNVGGVQATFDLKLVPDLQPSPQPLPNIFIIVMDSVRQDYLGAYNPRANFTPRLDAFARENIVFRRAFTQYAGTTLSEPAIWTGSLLLHSHYPQPFARLNSLEKMLRVDGYQKIVSYDIILSNILLAEDYVRLDTDRPWNTIELSATLKQLEHWLDQDRQLGRTRPVFFYTQPMNAHLRGVNDLPKASAADRRRWPGFVSRMAMATSQMDQFLGDFFDYLKARGLYDNSIIVITADHGEASMDLGRRSHSLVIFPEVMRVPLLVRVPPALRARFAYNENCVAALTDITPSLYSLVGHGPLIPNPLLGMPLFAPTHTELRGCSRQELFFASDIRPTYGILAGDGRWMYSVSDAPARRYLYDLASDPRGQHNLATDALTRGYDDRIVRHLLNIADFYGYKASGGAANHRYIEPQRPAR